MGAVVIFDQGLKFGIIFQEFELVQDDEGIIEYATKVVTFSSVHHLSLHFPTNFGEDVTQIYYIGLKGEF